MCRTRVSGLIVGVVLVLVAYASPTWTQQAPPPEGTTAGQVYKNIQVLGELPANRLMPAMHDMSTALGQECGFCHVEDLASDAKPMKDIARRMIHHDAGDQQRLVRGPSARGLRHLSSRRDTADRRPLGPTAAADW